MKTILQIEITHTKPLPEGITDKGAQAIYGWCYSKGCEVGVTARLMPVADVDLSQKEHEEPNHAAAA